MKRRFLAGVIPGAALAALAGSTGDAAYVDGVYWVKGDLYHVNATVHNDEPGDRGEIDLFLIYPEARAVEAWAPEHWFVSGICEEHVDWVPEGKMYRIQPGEVLSGFHFALRSEDYEPPFFYWMRNFDGYFTPELIPEPAWGMCVILPLTALALLRRRRGG